MSETPTRAGGPRPQARQEFVEHGRWKSHVNVAGDPAKAPVMLLHGSGPGASAWSNWESALATLGRDFLVLAPDLVGFSKTPAPELPDRASLWMDMWVEQILGLIDHYRLTQVNLVGNSLGGAVALHLAVRRPEAFKRLAFMGPVGVPCPLTRELDLIWGFYDNPSVHRMEAATSWFAYDRDFLGERLAPIATMRYEAAMQPHVRAAFAAMFPAPRQRHLDDLVVADSDLRRIRQPCLLIHGQNDTIVPVSTSHHLLAHLGGPVQMHIYNRCSHWTQIEHRESFEALVHGFFSAVL